MKGLFTFIIFVCLYYGAVVLQMKFFNFCLRKNRFFLIPIYMILTLFTMFVGLSAVIAMILTFGKVEKQRTAIYKEAAMHPCDEVVTELMEFIENYSCDNNPNAWNKLRAVWCSVNKSPNVTTEKKKELKQFLLLKGLILGYGNAKIIDNH